jgi:hypothetical protein
MLGRSRCLQASNDFHRLAEIPARLMASSSITNGIVTSF